MATRSRQGAGVTAAALFALLLAPSLVSAATFECKEIKIDDVKWDLSSLDKPVQIEGTMETEGVTYKNMTIDFSLCGVLPKVADRDYCPEGTSVCGSIRTINPKEDKALFIGGWTIAGEFKESPLNQKWERLKASSSAEDSKKEGLRGTFHGGTSDINGKSKKQTAIVEFICDKDKTGLEKVKLFDAKKPEPDTKPMPWEGEDKRPSLLWKSYVTTNENEDVLHLEWKTKVACEASEDRGTPKKSERWGFFTWVLIILFLVMASYLVFGSWINYSKNGARGWDLLPHSDTIRDVPYLLRDWARRVIDTFSGGGSIQLGGSRGGYAAV